MAGHFPFLLSDLLLATVLTWDIKGSMFFSERFSGKVQKFPEP
jgi:hypothetical protein